MHARLCVIKYNRSGQTKYHILQHHDQFVSPTCNPRMHNKLYRFALRITGSTHEAEDVVQDVMTKAWKATETPMAATIQNWEAWCMTLARNGSLDLNRSRNLRRTAPIDTTMHEAAVERATLPDYAAQQADLLAQVRKLMKICPEKQRLIMHLRDVEEMTYEEIAETLDVPGPYQSEFTPRPKNHSRTNDTPPLSPKIDIRYA